MDDKLFRITWVDVNNDCLVWYDGTDCPNEIIHRATNHVKGTINILDFFGIQEIRKQRNRSVNHE